MHVNLCSKQGRPCVPMFATMGDMNLRSAEENFGGTPEQGDHNPLEVFHAANTENAERMKKEGKDPIVFRLDGNEVHVFTKSKDVIKRIHEGNNWNMGDDQPDEDGYMTYVFTRFNEEELIEHLKNPSKHRGSD